MATGGEKRPAPAPADTDGKRRSGPPVESTLAYMRQEYERSTPWRNNVDAKLNSAAPFHFFLTRVKDIKETYDEDLSISFQELLDRSLGELEHCVHINYMVEVAWLLAQYAIVGLVNPPMTILYGPDNEELESLPAHIKVKPVKIKMSDPFGHHHSKMSLLFYKDGSSRVLIYTANLTESDWENRTQGIWISPRLAPLPPDAAAAAGAGESVTSFKKDLLQYLTRYQQSALQPWIQRLDNTDMSSVMVCLIASVPGTHPDNSFGYRKLRQSLQEHVNAPHAQMWNLVAQCSSIGSLGADPGSWLCGPFGRALEEKAAKEVSVRVIYPTLANVKASVDGMLGGACLPYSSATHRRQLWLKDQLWQWRSNGRHRSRAVPHIKTYSRLSPNGLSAAWFLLTSANLSKAAWGAPTTNGLHLRSFEVGVLFLPKFLTGENYFRVKTNGNFDKNEDFPFPYDSPLTPYTSKDQVFLHDKCFSI